jgi:hypothetical protein
LKAPLMCPMWLIYSENFNPLIWSPKQCVVRNANSKMH